MNLTEQEKRRFFSFPATDAYRIIEKILRDIIERSWKMRKTGSTADETLKNVAYGEGMEAGAIETLNLINKYSK